MPYQWPQILVLLDSNAPERDAEVSSFLLQREIQRGAIRKRARQVTAQTSAHAENPQAAGDNATRGSTAGAGGGREGRQSLGGESTSTDRPATVGTWDDSNLLAPWPLRRMQVYVGMIKSRVKPTLSKPAMEVLSK